MASILPVDRAERVVPDLVVRRRVLAHGLAELGLRGQVAVLRVDELDLGVRAVRPREREVDGGVRADPHEGLGLLEVGLHVRDVVPRDADEVARRARREIGEPDVERRLERHGRLVLPLRGGGGLRGAPAAAALTEVEDDLVQGDAERPELGRGEALRPDRHARPHDVARRPLVAPVPGDLRQQRRERLVRARARRGRAGAGLAEEGLALARRLERLLEREHAGGRRGSRCGRRLLRRSGRRRGLAAGGAAEDERGERGERGARGAAGHERSRGVRRSSVASSASRFATTRCSAVHSEAISSRLIPATTASRIRAGDRRERLRRAGARAREPDAGPATVVGVHLAADEAALHERREGARDVRGVGPGARGDLHLRDAGGLLDGDEHPELLRREPPPRDAVEDRALDAAARGGDEEPRVRLHARLRRHGTLRFQSLRSQAMDLRGVRDKARAGSPPSAVLGPKRAGARAPLLERGASDRPRNRTPARGSCWHRAGRARPSPSRAVFRMKSRRTSC